MRRDICCCGAMEVQLRPLQLLLLSASCLLCCTAMETRPCESEVYCYGDLLDAVQTARVFNDSKQFVDRPLRASPAEVLAAFEELINETNVTKTDLTNFVLNWTEEAGSDLLPWQPTDWVERPQFVEAISNAELKQWALDLNALWRTLGREVADSVHQSPSLHSLLPLPHPLIVPGGRFRETYYWDSYWIVQGLLLCQMRDTARGIITNLASLVERYGLVPNGGRVYYTRRSQPPLLTQMAKLYYNETKDQAFLEEILPSLAKEHAFWMADRRVAVSGYQLNRYAVDVSSARPESYIEDIETASSVDDAMKWQVYSNIASATESGWDFSSRWLRPPSSPDLSSVRTESIVPVELNAILCQNEDTLAQLFTIAGNDSEAARYRALLLQRQAAFNAVFWNETSGLWLDWDLDRNRHLEGFYASSLVPLLWNCSSSSSSQGEPSLPNTTQHKLVLNALRENGALDYPGGIPTSLVGETAVGQQWDFPNAWAPLQWFPVLAWAGAGETELADTARTIATTWLNTTFTTWERFNSTMFEKYDCRSLGEPGRGGEYALQTGFGWTNAVVLHFLSLYPDTNLSPQRTNSQRRPSLGWVAVIVLLVVSAAVAVPCVYWCKWLYKTGKKRYWGRVKNEHLVATGGGRSTPTVYTNKYVEHRDSALENREYYEWDT